MTAIQPPFTLYRLNAEPTTRNSPPLPAVALNEVHLDGSGTIRSHTITPDQARELAAGLIAAADQADRRGAPCPNEREAP